MRRAVGAAVLLLAICLPAGLAVAQEADADALPPGGEVAAQAQEEPESSTLMDPAEAELDARAAEVAGELRCPVCRNQSVLESNAELSREMQQVVRERLAAGETPEEVKEYFVSRYGEWILLQPQARGINLLVYGLPGLALIVGFLVARNRLRKWAVAGATEAAAATSVRSEDVSADDEKWLRQALREG